MNIKLECECWNKFMQDLLENDLPHLEAHAQIYESAKIWK